MKNKKVKKQIIRTEILVRNGCLPSVYDFKFHNGDFGCWVLLRSGWFFRGIYRGVISLTADQLRGK